MIDDTGGIAANCSANAAFHEKAQARARDSGARGPRPHHH